MSRSDLQTILMPAAMIVGGVFHDQVTKLDFLTPYLIFSMLFIPFCGVKIREMKISGLHINLLLFQAVMSVLAYAVFGLFDADVAQGAMMCFLAPTATAAVVIAGMLGARVSTMLTYSLLVNFAVALGAPLLFSIIAPTADVPFLESFIVIFLRVIPVIVLPCVGARLIRHFFARLADGIQKLRPASFYLWLVALTIVTGRIVNFVATQAGLTIGKGLALAGVSLVICASQFLIGRYIGRKWGETVAGGQLLGQKNTILAIWLAQTYLNPVSSIAPAAYVLWQNIFNSVQLYLKNKKR
jgi:BASS family bile acid:Na+ symporter